MRFVRDFRKWGDAGVPSFGDLIVLYLFLGGASGGAYLCWWGMTLRFARLGAAFARAIRRFTPRILAAVFVTLAVGSVCLVADLASPAQAHILFFRPTPTILSIGAFALLAFGAVVVALFGIHAGGPSFEARHPRAYRILGFAGALLAAVVVLYTGVFLYQIGAVPFWDSWFIVALFAVSAVSTGMALVSVVYASCCGLAFRLTAPLKETLLVDVVLIAVELVLLAGLLLESMADPVCAASVDMLMRGSLSLPFSAGVVLCGLIVPFVGEIVALRTKSRGFMQYIVIGACILLGGFFLRYCIIHAGLHLSGFMFAGLN